MHCRLRQKRTEVGLSVWPRTWAQKHAPAYPEDTCRDPDNPGPCRHRAAPAADHVRFGVDLPPSHLPSGTKRQPYGFALFVEIACIRTVLTLHTAALAKQPTGLSTRPDFWYRGGQYSAVFDLT